MRSLLLSVLALSFACAPVRGETKESSSSKTKLIDELTIPSIPEWTDRYADGKKGDVRFFNLTKIMKRFDVDRLGAIEIQNTYRDLTRADIQKAGDLGLQEAVRIVKSGTLESGVDRAALKSARFIVIFDLDETLYDQYYGGGETCNTHAYKRDNGQMKYIYMVPGWQNAIKSLVALGGKVVIFSANLDDTTLGNLGKIELDGKALTESPLISGIMTNSHLIQQEKTEPPGSEKKPRKGRPVIEPSKDLRFFDESLSRVIIVDDNPLRLFQFKNTRIFKKFHADTYCKTEDTVLKGSYDSAMAVVVAEVKESVAYMDKHPGVDFKTAYLPYTALGQTTLRFLTAGNVRTPAQAMDHIRRNPSVVDKRY